MSSLHTVQRGAVLLVAMILLLVLTLVGIATMESTGMEMKMANQSRERLIAMQAAEAGLRAAETFIQTTGFSDAELDNSGGCSTRCFKADCSSGGYCFNGANASNWSSCAVAPLAVPVWENSTLNLWKTAGRYQQLASASLTAKVQYIVEFLCYIPDTPGGALSSTNKNQLFRITSLATTNSGKSRVMLQSTYKFKG